MSLWDSPTTRSRPASYWATDPVLRRGVLGWDETNKVGRFGDGVTPWSGLPNVGGGESTSMDRITSWVQQNSNGTWPPRPTASTAVLVFWRTIAGGAAPTEVASGTGGAHSGRDIIIRVP